MQAEISKQVTITLTMGLDDAIWLRGVMQNPFFDPEDEATATIRHAFFAVLHRIILDANS